MPLTTERVRELLTSLEVSWSAADDEPGLTETVWQCEQFRDSLGNAALLVFLALDDDGEVLSLQTQPVFDLSRVRFSGPLVARMLELSSERVAARFVREPAGTQIALRLDLPILDGELGPRQLLFALEQLVTTVDETHLELRATSERGQSPGFARDPAGDAP